MEAAEYRQRYEIEESYWYFVSQHRLLCSVVSSFSVSGGKILDAGCGTGRLLTLMESYGRGYGLDLSGEALAFCRERGLQRLTRTDLSCGVPFQDGTFDVITAVDVLEHLGREAEALKDFFRTLKSGGRVLIAVPAYMFLWSDHDVAAHHKRRYSRRQLIRVLSEAGFFVERITYSMTLLFPLAVAFRMLRKLWKGQGPPRTDLFLSLPSVVNWTLIGISCFEAVLLRRMNFPFGVSLLCVARRPDTMTVE